ncbi:hypothetical protein [Listeria aquatica]
MFFVIESCWVFRYDEERGMEGQVMTRNDEEPKMFDKEKVKEVSEKIEEKAGDAAGKAGEVLGDTAKLAFYGSLEAAKVIGKTGGAFFKGLKRGFDGDQDKE